MPLNCRQICRQWFSGQGRQGTRSLDGPSVLRAGRLGQAAGRRLPARTLGRNTLHTAGELGTAIARLAPAPPDTELGTTSTRLGPPKQWLEPADALRQGRPGRQQGPPGQRTILGPCATRTPGQSRSLARHPGRDGRRACGSGHCPRAPLSGCTGPGPCLRAIAGDRLGRRKTRPARCSAKLAALPDLRPSPPPLCLRASTAALTTRPCSASFSGLTPRGLRSKIRRAKWWLA